MRVRTKTETTKRQSSILSCEGAKTTHMGLVLGLAVGVIYCGIGKLFQKLSRVSLGPASIGVVTLGVLTRIMFGVFASVGVIGLSGMSKQQLLVYCLVLMVMSSVVHPILSIRK